MTRALSTTVGVAVAQTVTLPGYLIEIGFPTVIRQSSRGDVTIGDRIFASGAFTVEGAESDAVAASCRIRFADSDSAIATLVMLYGVTDRTVNIWKFYGDAPTQLDLLHVFGGIGVSVEGDTENWEVVIEAATRDAAAQYAPRQYITQAEGFNYLPAAGTMISFGGQQFILESGVSYPSQATPAAPSGPRVFRIL